MRNFNVREHIMKSIQEMRNRNVVLYGAGERGKKALKMLDGLGIAVSHVADRVQGKEIGGHRTISLDELIKASNGEICIVTPARGIQEEKEALEKAFELADYSMIRFLEYCFPQRDIRQMTACVPFNHYESPYPNEEEIENYDYKSVPVRDIELNEREQVSFLGVIKKYGKEFGMLHGDRGGRTRFKSNGMFDGLDAIVLHTMLRHYAPKRYVEVGSGFSTGIVLDANEFCMKNRTEITCIEPHPERLKSILKDEDDVRIIEKPIQEVELSLFDGLEENDILFIDSSHVAKWGGRRPVRIFPGTAPSEERRVDTRS